MENDLGRIVWQIGAHMEDLKINYDGTIEDIETASVDAVVNELLKDANADEINKIMMNMYFAGKLRSIIIHI
jgi:hypothetical protein